MKIYCFSCKELIPNVNINLNTSLAKCECGEVYDINVLLGDKSEIPQVEKPAKVKVLFEKKDDRIGLIVPASGFNGTTIFFFIFTTFWNAMTWFALLSQGGPSIIFLLPFVIIGLITLFLFLFFWKSKTFVLMTKDKVRVRRELFGFSRKKERPFRDIELIQKTECYSSNDVPVYGVGILFNDEKKYMFGSEISEEEKDWLLYEFYSFWRENS